MTPASPPRSFGLPARAAPIAALFRRGPVRRVLPLTGGLRDDRITPGQWRRNRLQERRADLSRDDRQLISFAMGGRRQGPPGGAWTAIGRPTWLTAHHLCPRGHGRNGGGLCPDTRRSGLNGQGMNGTVHGPGGDAGPKAVGTAPPGVASLMGEDPVTSHPRLLRDGWTFAGAQRHGRGRLAHLCTTPPGPGRTLRKTLHIGRPDGRPGPACCETAGPAGFAERRADVHGRELVFARDGAVWRQRLHRKDPAAPRQITDLGPLAFRPAAASPAGVSLRMPAGAPR